jgi:uncharacterized membrane protein YwzB
MSRSQKRYRSSSNSRKRGKRIKELWKQKLYIIVAIILGVIVAKFLLPRFFE